MTKVHFTSRTAADAAMGSLRRSGAIRTWTGKQTSKGFSVRYLTACGQAWFDLTAFDMDRFFGASVAA